MRLLSAVALAACLLTAQLARTDEQTPSYTAADVQDLVRAVLRIPIDHEFTLGLQMAAPSALPAWDPIAHYAGPTQMPDGQTAYVVLVSDRYERELKNLARANRSIGAAVLSAVFLATMDAGRAGPKWKALYDRAATADSSMDPNVTDRYRNRHILVEKLATSQTALYAQIVPTDTPSMDEFGLPLSEPIDYGTGLVGLARLGIGADRLIELFEYPGALQETSTQKFIGQWFERFGAVLPSDQLRARLSALRPLFTLSAPQEQITHEHSFVRNLLALVHSLPAADVEAFGIGYDASEIRYNALALKNGEEDASLRELLFASTVLDSSFPSLSEARAELASAKPGEWPEIARLAGWIVTILLPARS
jgi:hypothetical protein